MTQGHRRPHARIFHNFYSECYGNQLKVNATAGSCSTRDTDKTGVKIVIGNSEEKTLLGRRRNDR
jgi:hypothetical protein